ncbi:FecR domain-containing protein [Acidovorax sp. NCPPB 2350]|nr:FecR domain-containing protein [Acidovorax sp. NCPPB 2350]
MSADGAEESALRAAVDWRVRQESGRFGERDRQSFERWLATADHHRAAWARVAGVLEGPLAAVRAADAGGAGPAQVALQAFSQAQARRRRVLRGALALAGTGTATALVADRFAPVRDWTADLRTGTGQRREFTLADGTAVLLDARSAADVEGGGGAPGLRLRAGALIATPGTRGGDPLAVRTRDGEAVSGGGRFLCRCLPDATEAVALAGELRIRPQGGPARVLRAGEGAWFSAGGGVRAIPGRAADRAAWREGMLAVDDWPLGEVVEALRTYHAGLIRVSPEAAAVRVFGIFRLDVDEVLQTLAHTLPVRVRRLGPWLAAIDRAAA